MSVRFPAEWEPHDATWLAWPHNSEDWPGKFEPIEWVFCEIIRAITPGERVELVCNTPVALERATECLALSHIPLERVRLHVLPTDRGWMRDAAPTFVHRDERSLSPVRWGFTGWAKYDNHTLDARIPELVESVTGLPLSAALRHDTGKPLVLEGGGIETDGQGLLLTTEECLLHPSIQVRNHDFSREDYERAFAECLGISRTVWLGSGCAGDDTHGHIDDLARCTPDGSVLLAYEADASDDNHAMSVDNEQRLRAAGLRVVRLPFPSAVWFDDQRLPASYANFYCCNAGVLVPTFNDPLDRVALNTIAKAFPDRPVTPIFARDLVLGLGTIHCLTQQQPAAIPAR